MSSNNQIPKQNWRMKRAPPQTRQAVRQQGKTHSGLSSAAASTQSIVLGKNTGGLRESDKIHAPAIYTPGCIFSAPFHSQDVDLGHKDVEKVNHRTESVHGPIHSKFRKLVVVKSYFKHCVVVPMYSYEGSGLKNKSDYIHEYISIRDPNQINANTIVPDTQHGILWTDGTNRKSPDDKRFYATNPSSVLHLTHLFSHDYMMKSTLHGRLREESTERLVALFEEVAKKDMRWAVIGDGVVTRSGDGGGGTRKWLNGDWPGVGEAAFGAPSV